MGHTFVIDIDVNMKLPTSFIVTAAASISSVSAFGLRSSYVFAPTACNLANKGRTYHRSTTVLAMSSDSLMEFVKEEIASGDVVVFSKSFCPFCKATKALFADNNIEAKIIEL